MTPGGENERREYSSIVSRGAPARSEMTGTEAEPCAPAAEVLRFWFGDAPGVARPEWFRKDDAFDAAIAGRFGALIDTALAGDLDGWADDPRSGLALVIVLDQFPRNVFRGTPRAFAGDARALAVAEGLVSRGEDSRLLAVERWFLYLPFEHSEALAVQKRSVELFARLRDDTGEAGPLEWAWRHYDVVVRFGRFPHRNAILGRESTPAEREFLAQPGSSF
jgi:uncharacterized protein (DUF924 family)